MVGLTSRILENFGKLAQLSSLYNCGLSKQANVTALMIVFLLFKICFLKLGAQALG